MIAPEERRLAIALLVAILEGADDDLAGEIVTASVLALVDRWRREARASRAAAAREKPPTYAGAWPSWRTTNAAAGPQPI